MKSDNFEKAFGNFIDRPEYDKAQGSLFEIVRHSFTAGWESAGGNPPSSQPVLQFIPKKLDTPEK